MDQIKIGKFIAACRKEQGMTQAVLAERIGISDRAVSKWETGRAMPDLENLELLSQLLDISVGELLKGERLASQPTKEDMAQVSSASFSLAKLYVQKRKRLSLGLGFLCGLLMTLLAVIHLTSPAPITDIEHALRIEVLRNEEILAVMDGSVAGYDVKTQIDPDHGTSSVFVSCYSTHWNRIFGGSNRTIAVIGTLDETDYVYYHPSDEADELIWVNPASEEPDTEVLTLPRLVYNYWLIITAVLFVIGAAVCIAVRGKRIFAIAVKTTMIPGALFGGIAGTVIGNGQIYHSAYYASGIILTSIVLYAAMRTGLELCRHEGPSEQKNEAFVR